MSKKVQKKDQIPMELDAIRAAKIQAKQKVEEKETLKKEGEYIQSCGSYNFNVKMKHVPEEMKNSYENYAFIKWQFTRRWKSRRAKYIGELGIEEGAPPTKGPILVLGSGPSLDHALPLLKHWQGAVICSTSHASSCVHAGKDPTYIMALDHRAQPSDLNVNWWHGRNSALINQPTQNPAFGPAWKKQTYYFWKRVPDISFHCETIPIVFGDWIKTHLFVFSCSVPAQMGLAYMMGYSPIILVGCDFGINRFRKWSYEKRHKYLPRTWPLGKWVHKATSVSDAKNLVIAENGVKTNKIQLYYKRSVVCAWRLDQAQVIEAVYGLNSGEPKTSIMEEFPKMDMAELIQNQGTNVEHLLLSEEEIRDRADRYLIGQKTYTIPLGKIAETKRGMFFQEFNDWRKTLPLLVRDLHKGGAETDLKEMTDRFERLEREYKAARTDG